LSNNEAHLVVDDRRARIMLANLDKAGGDMSGPMRRISHKMRNSIDENFEKGGRFNRAGSIFGGPRHWEKKADGKPSFLQKDGHLRRSFMPESTATEATVSTNLEYAARLNFGSPMGPRASLLTRRQTSSQGTPARPFMVIQNADVEEYKGIIRAHLLGGAAK